MMEIGESKPRDVVVRETMSNEAGGGPHIYGRLVGEDSALVLRKGTQIMAFKLANCQQSSTSSDAKSNAKSNAKGDAKASSDAKDPSGWDLAGRQWMSVQLNRTILHVSWLLSLIEGRVVHTKNLASTLPPCISSGEFTVIPSRTWP